MIDLFQDNKIAAFVRLELEKIQKNREKDYIADISPHREGIRVGLPFTDAENNAFIEKLREKIGKTPHWRDIYVVEDRRQYALAAQSLVTDKINRIASQYNQDRAAKLSNKTRKKLEKKGFRTISEKEVIQAIRPSYKGFQPHIMITAKPTAQKKMKPKYPK